MQFSFTEEQQLFADSVRKFALAHLDKDKLKRAHDPRYPFDVRFFTLLRVVDFFPDFDFLPVLDFLPTLDFLPALDVFADFR